MLLIINLLFFLAVSSYALASAMLEGAFQAPPCFRTQSQQADDPASRPTKARPPRTTHSYSYRESDVSTLRHFPQALDITLYDNPVLTSVEGLRVRHGPRLFPLGDFDHLETRYVYHRLLPTQLLEYVKENKEEISSMPVEELAYMASMARHAARIYARERSCWYLCLLAGLYDGIRHLRSYGHWSWTGMTYEQIWDKYESKLRAELGPDVSEEELNRRVALRIIEKSCQTNKAFDKIGNVEEALSRFRAGQSWRSSSLMDRLRLQSSVVVKNYLMTGARTMLS